MDDVEKVKSKLDIVEIIGEHIQLKKAGRNFKALCPFHGEKTPSFVVSPERQIWHCFGCGKGGDIFTFLEEYENITFAEALKETAARAGVKLTISAARTDREKKQELIYGLNHLSAQFYNYLLLSHPAGKRALKYLIDERKLSIPLIKTFNLGYAPEKDALVRYLIGKKKYKEDDLLVSGLAYRTGRNASGPGGPPARGVSDFFRDRIIFPIIDQRGNIIAFSGRLLEPTGPELVERAGGKYVNTRETPVYIKGDTVYGLNLARDGIKKEGKVIIVEGEFDVITAHKQGIPNIVAVKGTALTENQIKLLKRFAPKFALCFDTDPAGTEAQRRSIKMIEREGITATVISLQGTRGESVKPKDPDELLNENPIAFKKALVNDINIYDFIIDTALGESDSKTAEGKKRILDRTLPYLSNIENDVIKEHYLKKLANAIDATLEAIMKQADKAVRPRSETTKASPRTQLPREELAEIYLISLIFQSENPKQSLNFARTLLSGVKLSTPSIEKLLSFLDTYAQTGDFNAQDFSKYLPHELHLPFDTSYLASIPEFLDKDHFYRELEKAAKQVRILAIKKTLSKLTTLISQAEQEQNKENLKTYQEKFSELSKLLAS
ncbi:MAG: DNA primase [Candidatus Levybacteria bacterium RIFCSPLOWO2_12_FULL_40_10]|nr:MAG: DNA primase [Candidatus Levybacteria bacterium RIFCSPLOWO2_12_FULL_40_10]